MKKNKKIALSVIGIFLLIMLVISFSYAYWLISKTQEGTNEIGTGCLDISLVGENGINLSNAYPLSDEEGMQTTPYTFTITNTCSIFVSYQVNLEVHKDTTLNTNYLQVGLDNEKLGILGSKTEVLPTITDYDKAYNLKTGYLAEGESKTYNLREWLDKDTPLEEGIDKLIRTKISVTATPFKKPETLSYVKTFGGSSGDNFNSVVESADGSIIAVGYSASTDQDLEGLNKGDDDAIIVKYNPDGNIIWKKTFGGSSFDYFYSVAVNEDGSIIVVGYSESTDQDLEGLNKGSSDAIIVKYDSEGNLIWKKSFGGSDGDCFESVVVGKDSSIITVGFSHSTDQDLEGLNKGYVDAIIVKYDPDGNVIWKKTFGGNEIDNFISVVASEEGSIIVVGESYSTDQDLEGLNKGDSDAIIVKYDPDGNVIWKKTYGGGGWDVFNSLFQIDDNTIIAVGESTSIDQDLEGLNKGGHDAIIVKYFEQ